MNDGRALDGEDLDYVLRSVLRDLPYRPLPLDEKSPRLQPALAGGQPAVVLEGVGGRVSGSQVLAERYLFMSTCLTHGVRQLLR